MSITPPACENQHKQQTKHMTPPACESPNTKDQKKYNKINWVQYLPLFGYHKSQRIANKKKKTEFKETIRSTKTKEPKNKEMFETQEKTRQLKNQLVINQII